MSGFNVSDGKILIEKERHYSWTDEKKKEQQEFCQSCIEVEELKSLATKKKKKNTVARNKAQHKHRS